MHRNRSIVAASLVSGRFVSIIGGVFLVHAALFSYIGGATFIQQETYGLSPQGYSYAFGVNSMGVIVFSRLGGRAARSWGERTVITAGIAALTISGVGLLAAGVFSLPLVAALVSLFVLVATVSATVPPLTALALGAHPRTAGTASSLLGMARCGFGGLAAPLVGLGGAARWPAEVTTDPPALPGASRCRVFCLDDRLCRPDPRAAEGGAARPPRRGPACRDRARSVSRARHRSAGRPRLPHRA